jgi:peptidoglycan/LPS O-acetylase OafA/YrhL
MAEQHRSTTPDGGAVTSAVRRRLQLAGIVLVVLAGLCLLAFAIYAARTHLGVAYPFEVAFCAAVWVIGCASSILTLPRNWPRSPAEVASATEKVLWLAMATGVLLLVIGSRQGWADGALGVVLVSPMLLYALYMLVGKRLLQTFLKSRAASRLHPS